MDSSEPKSWYVVEYLAMDVLQRLPDDLRTFLRQTAILEQLTAPLCDAVTERTDSAARLRQIERQRGGHLDRRDYAEVLAEVAQDRRVQRG